jgi:Spy/CpxP family protein refolding chaperone
MQRFFVVEAAHASSSDGDSNLHPTGTKRGWHGSRFSQHGAQKIEGSNLRLESQDQVFAVMGG